MRIEQIKRETEKAVLLVVEVENAIGRRAAEIWFPRSQITIVGEEFSAPAWLVAAKLTDRYGECVARASWIN